MTAETKGPALDGGAVDRLPTIIAVCQLAGVSRPASYVVTLPPDVYSKAVARLLNQNVDSAMRAFLSTGSPADAEALFDAVDAMLRCLPEAERAPFRRWFEEFVRDRTAKGTS